VTQPPPTRNARRRVASRNSASPAISYATPRRGSTRRPARVPGGFPTGTPLFLPEEEETEKASDDGWEPVSDEAADADVPDRPAQNPGNDPDPGDGDDDPNPFNGDFGDDADDDVPNPPPQDMTIAQAIGLLANTLDGRARPPPPPQAPRDSRTKAREPDTFSGAKPEDLHQFLFQCRLYFRSKAGQYPTDADKVNFALTYLTDTALRWFETAIDQEEVHGIYQAWSTDWSLFVLELKTHFGIADPRGESAELLDNLRMKYGDRITIYNVEFMCLSSQLTWNDEVLCHRYYKGLPDRLQDALCSRPAGKPTTFNEMQATALIFDNRYWERQREKTRAKSAAESASAPVNKVPSRNQFPSNTNTSTSTSTSNSRPNNNNNKGNNAKPSSSTPAPSSASKSTPAPKPDLSDKLGKDGKLTTDERQRRMDGNLCLFCGNAGHKVNECRKKAASAAKAIARRAELDGKSSDKSSGK
jgi:hypothetical protein